MGPGCYLTPLGEPDLQDEEVGRGLLSRVEGYVRDSDY